MAFFQLATPRDMLNKARREHERLTENFDIDNLFNFFVTATHIRDYVRRASSVPPEAIGSFVADADIRDARDLCDKGKHLTLTHRPDPQTRTYSGAIGGAPLGALPIGGSGKWFLDDETRLVDVADLAGRVLQKWEYFFLQHDL